MTTYTIEKFWIPRLGKNCTVSQEAPDSLIKGWSFKDTGPEAFVEAPLTLSTEFGDNCDPYCSPVLLVSAPGAVGKSTLAQQIAFSTGSVYIDLAKTEPVGANTLTGGLVKSGLYEYWANGSLAVLIDGLDEARLMVTQEAFQAFLSDVAGCSKDRVAPTVLLGRTGAVQDAWVSLFDQCPNIEVLEIGYFGPEDSVDFAEKKLQALKPDNSHAAITRNAIKLLLQQLRSQTESDGDRFAGYAPVLQAVAERIARESNLGALIEKIKQGAQPVTLRTIIRAILEREKGKLSTLSFNKPNLADTLYSPTEQLARLVAHVYNILPPELPEMDPKDVEQYSQALDTWVAEHPFLDGGTGTSSAIFDAVISTRALLTSAASEKALQKELSRGAAANPFLFKFYTDEIDESNGSFIQGEHIGIVYASLRAGLSLGDTASLLIEGHASIEGAEALQAEVEITLTRRGKNTSRGFQFSTAQDVIHLGVYVEDVDIVVSGALIEIGQGSEATLIAPINIECMDLSISTEKVIAKNPSGQQATGIYLKASKSFEGTSMRSIPVIHDNVTLFASWPDARTHPWTNFAAESSLPQDPRVEEALRRFRKFVITFRSHGRNGLARFKGKIEHARMTKGTGQAVLDFMVNNDILSLKDRLYHLDVAKLFELTGTTYSDCLACRFESKAVDFVEKALGNSEN